MKEAFKSAKNDKINNKKDYSVLSFIILTFIFLFQFSSKTQEIQLNMNLSNDESKNSQNSSTNYIFWKYIILSQLSQSINFFLSNNIKNTSLNIHSFIIIIILSLIFSILFSKKLTGNNQGNFYYGIFILCFSFYSVLMSFNILNLNNNYLFQTIYRIYILFNNIIFIINFENECNLLISDKIIKNNLINNYIEKNELIIIFMKVLFQFILTYINNSLFFKYNLINTPSNLLCPLLSLFLIFISQCWNKKIEINNNEVDEIIKNLNNFKKLFIIGITEFFINFSYYLYKYGILPYISEINNYYIYNLFIPSLLAGITSFRIFYSFYNSNMSSIAKINSLIFVFGVFIIQFYKDFNQNLYGALLIEASYGLYSVLYKRIKIYILKDKLNYEKFRIWLFLELLKISAEIIVSKFINNFNKPILFCLIFYFISFIIIYFVLEDIIIEKKKLMML